jgi:hypothetical protein
MLSFAISKEREFLHLSDDRPAISETASTSAHGPIIPRRVSAERIIESFFVIMPHDAGLHGQAVDGCRRQGHDPVEDRIHRFGDIITRLRLTPRRV